MKTHDGKVMSTASIACYVLAIVVILVDPNQYVLAVLFLLLGKESEYYPVDTMDNDALDDYEEWLQDESDRMDAQLGDTKSTTNTLEKSKGGKDGTK
jgi:hypothetical protein